MDFYYLCLKNNNIDKLNELKKKYINFNIKEEEEEEEEEIGNYLNFYLKNNNLKSLKENLKFKNEKEIIKEIQNTSSFSESLLNELKCQKIKNFLLFQFKILKEEEEEKENLIKTIEIFTLNKKCKIYNI